jgi:heavy metal sensor kinase
MSSARPPAQRGSFFASIGQFIHSIRFRLTLWTAAVLTVILFVFCVFIYTRQAYDMQLHMQAQLQLKSQQLASIYRLVGVNSDDDSSEPILPGSIQSGIPLAEYHLLAVVRSTGQTVQKAGGIDDATLKTLVNSWQAAGQASSSLGYKLWLANTDDHDITGDYLFAVTPILVERRLVGLVVLGAPLDPDGQMPRLVVSLLLGSLVTLAAALGGGYWVASRAMAPVRTITRAAREIGETGLDKRLQLKSRDELGELAATFDEMLDRLQAAFNRQRQFTADASHELRTPLTIVGIETDQALSRRRSPEEYERAIKVIKSENEFMAHLVNDLLTLARMDAGQTRLRLEALDLSDLALDNTERLTSLARVKNVELILGELPEANILGDRQFLSQALANLIENAIKYAGGREGRGGHVHIETGSRESGGKRRAWVEVADDGPGIAAEHLPRLFDRFYRVDKARTREEEESGDKQPDGSGLGLSIVQWIIHAHNGEIRVRSEPGAGTTFEIDLPWANE